MSAVWLRFGAELRTRWRAWLGLALLVGIVAGACMALAAGARRTNTAYPRLVEQERPYDAVVFASEFFGDIAVPEDFSQRIARLPQVVEAAAFSSLSDNGGVTDDGRAIGEPDYLQTIVPLDERATAALERQKLLTGRHPDPEAADEVAINFTVAERYELDVGDTFELELFTAEQVRSFGISSVPPEPGRMHRFDVVGLFAAAGDFPPRSLGDGAGRMTLTPAFAARYPELVPFDVLTVRLTEGRGEVRSFRAEVVEIAGGGSISFDSLGDFSIALQHDATQRAIHLLAVTLWVLTGLAVTAAVLIIGQALLRSGTMEAADQFRLRALGLTRVQLVALGVIRGGLIALPGALFAATFAFLLSPLFPLGLARTAEPDPGLRLDVTALLFGTVATVAAVCLLSAVAAWRASRVPGGATGPTARALRVSRVGTAVTGAGLPPTAVAGVRMALEAGRGSTAVPARTTIFGAVAGVAALAGALTFGAGLDHLLATPRLYGWNWDVTIGDGYGSDAYDQVVPALAESPVVDSFGAGTFAALVVDDREIFAMAIDPVRGSIAPSVIEGRAPAGRDEILLGSATMDALDLSVGDEASAQFVGTFNAGEAPEKPPPRRLTVVGRGVLPEQSDIGLDDAAAMTYAGIVELSGERPNRNFFPITLTEGVQPDDALARLDEAVDLYTVPRQQPTDLVNFGRTEALPLIGSGLLGLVAAAMVTHLLLSSVRRRRRDLALLKTLGLTGRQVSQTVAWQASTLAVVALLVGLPLGAAAGRWAWTIAADRLGVVAEPVVPIGALIALAPLTLVVVNVVAAVPAWLAARTRPADVLRSE